MAKKTFCKLCAVLLLIVFVLSGCGEDKTNSVNFDETGAYVPTEDLNLTIWYTQGTEYTRADTIEDNVVSDWLYGKTKVNIDSIYGNDGGQWDTKLSRLIAGNNLPDIVVCAAGQGPSHFAKLVQAKSLHEITDEMLDKYLPNVKKRVSPELLENYIIDGKLYGLPFGDDSNETNQPEMSAEQLETVQNSLIMPQSDKNLGLWVRDDILKMIYPETKSWEDLCAILEETGEPIGDELCDVPIYTTQDYIDFLYKIQELSLTAPNGKPVYAFGYAGTDSWVGLTYLGGDMMGYAPHFYTGSWNVKEQSVRIPLVEDTLREAARIENKMINDRVIDPESLVNSSSAYKEKVINGQYAVCPITYTGMNESDVNNTIKSSGFDFQYRPIYVNVPNLEDYLPYKTETYNGSSIAFTTALSDEEFIQALNWVNTQFSDEFEEVYWWGPEEAGYYTETEDGKRTYTEEALNKAYIEGDTSEFDKKGSHGIGQGTSVGQMYIAPVKTAQSRFNPVLYNNAIKLTPYNFACRALSFKTTSPHVTELETGFSANPWDPTYADIPEVVKYWAEREQWENPFKIAISVAPEEFDAAWDSAIANLNSIVNVEEMCAKMTEAARAAMAEK